MFLFVDDVSWLEDHPEQRKCDQARSNHGISIFSLGTRFILEMVQQERDVHLFGMILRCLPVLANLDKMMDQHHVRVVYRKLVLEFQRLTGVVLDDIFQSREELWRIDLKSGAGELALFVKPAEVL